MDNKQAFQTWTPARAWAWTRFAKAAQFQDDAAFAPSDTSRNYAAHLIGTDLPFELRAYDYGDTVVIVDLPGVASIQYGLKLYMQNGLQPIPMFNAVTGVDTGGRSDVVDTANITKALAAGTYVLASESPARNQGNYNSPVLPAFLLDYNRDNSQTYGTDVYDNRWTVTPNDLPDAAYLKNAGIKKVLYITTGTPHNDIAGILSDYQRSGLKVQVFQNGQFSDWTWDNLELKDLASIPQPDVPTPEMLIAKTHPSRRILMWIFGILAAISALNAFTQWTTGGPLFWTIPGAQWLIYDIVPEAIGDVFLILFTLFNVLIWWMIKNGNDKAIRIGWYAFIVDALWFFIYAITYTAPAEAWNAGQRGLMAFAETPAYALFAFGLPIALAALIGLSYRKYRKHIGSKTPPGWYASSKDSTEHRYWNGVTWDDRLRYQEELGLPYSYYTVATRPVFISSRPMFIRTRPTVRTYGYSGYGGTGMGGYGGYGGYGGGHGG